MRNPDRIPEVLSELMRFWKNNPDWRLGQVIVNVTGTSDPFNVEDDELLKRLMMANVKQGA